MNHAEVRVGRADRRSRSASAITLGNHAAVRPDRPDTASIRGRRTNVIGIELRRRGRQVNRAIRADQADNPRHSRGGRA